MQAKKATFDTFPARLKTAMAASDISAAELSRAIGVSHVAVGLWLHGRRVPRATELYLLAQKLRLPMEYFVENEGRLRMRVKTECESAANIVDGLDVTEADKQNLFGAVAVELASAGLVLGEEKPECNPAQRLDKLKQIRASAPKVYAALNTLVDCVHQELKEKTREAK
ncbi:MAG: helix-turn-helix domain-containing protein [Limisphaerales bacterium]